jgi:hypothetical protein
LRGRRLGWVGRCRFFRDHPWLGLGGFVVLGKLQHPIGVDQLVAKIEVHALQTSERQIIRRDAIGPHQQKQVGCWVRRTGGSVWLGPLLGDAAFHFGLDFSGSGAR